MKNFGPSGVLIVLPVFGMVWTFFCIVAFEFYDGVDYAFLEKCSVVKSNWVVVLIVVSEFCFRDKFFHG